jgi:hypothetical protein
VRNALVVAAVLVAGCAESRMTAPAGETFDAAAAGRANVTMTALVSGSGMSAVAALSGRMPAELSPSGPVVGPSVAAASGVTALALRLLHSLPAAGGPLTVQVIRPGVLGHTYVYSPSAHRYIPDPARGGAPSNGVRFILYAVDPGTHDPRVDQETGYGDLTDDGAPGFGVGLHFRAVAAGTTFLDYAFTVTPTFTGGLLHVSGFLADDRNRLDFTIGSAAQSLGETQTAHVSFEIAVASQRFHATGSIDAEAPAGTARVDVVVSIGADAIHLAGESTAATVHAALSVNGHLFATITGDPRHPTVRADGGRELTPAETEVLGGLVGMVYGVIEMFEHLLEPVAALLGISVSL